MIYPKMDVGNLSTKIQVELAWPFKHTHIISSEKVTNTHFSLRSSDIAASVFAENVIL